MLLEFHSKHCNFNLIKSDYTAAFTSYDLGGVLSLGFAYLVSDYLIIDGSLRYDAGFTDVEENNYSPNIHDPSDVVTPSPAASPRTETYNMSVGLTFGVRYLF